MKAKNAGFTLIELMFTLIVLAILLGIGVPNFRDFMRTSRMASATNDLITDFNLARSEAVKRRVPVTLCKSQDGANCDPDDSDPFHRWIVFVDDANPAATAPADGNGVVDGGETVLRERSIHATIEPAAVGRRMVFLPSGFPNNALAGTIQQVVLCDARGNVTSVGGDSAARAVTVSTTGRAASTRHTTTIATLGGCP